MQSINHDEEDAVFIGLFAFYFPRIFLTLRIIFTLSSVVRSSSFVSLLRISCQLLFLIIIMFYF